jgi:hypothetical protein
MMKNEMLLVTRQRKNHQLIGVPPNVHHQSKGRDWDNTGSSGGNWLFSFFRCSGGWFSYIGSDRARRVHRLDPPRLKLCQPDREASALFPPEGFFTG